MVGVNMPGLINMAGLIRWLPAFPLLVAALSAATCPPAAMKPDDSRAGTLNERDCRISDAFENEPGGQAFVDIYTIAIPEAGTLTVTASSPRFTAQVRLYDGRGRRLAATEGGPTARLRLEVQAGQHTVYVSSEGVKTGTYTIVTSFKATPECVDRRVAPDGETMGDLSLGDCRHPIAIKQRGTLIVELQAADAEVFLRQGRDELQRDRSRIVRELEGDYTIVVHPTRPRSGAYRLQTQFCPGSRELSLNAPVEATVSEACRAATGDVPQAYSLKLAAGALVKVELQTHGVGDLAWQPLVMLSGTGMESLEGKPPLTRALGAGTYSVSVKLPKGAAGSYSLTARGLCRLTEIKPNSTAAGAFAAGGCISGTVLNSHESFPAVVYHLHTDQSCEFSPAIEPKGIARFTLLDPAGKPAASALWRPGEHLVMVTALNAAAKSFRLETRCRRACVPDELRLNDIQEGRIFPNDCRLSDIVPSADGSPAHLYRLRLALPATVNFEFPSADAGAATGAVPGAAISAAPGASLLLLKGDGANLELIEENREIHRTLESGVYSVVVKSPRPMAYELRAAVPCTPVNLQTDQPVSGTLSETDCYDGAGSYYRRYRILPDRTAVLELTAASKSFDPVLNISDANGYETANTGIAGGPPAAIRGIVESGGVYAVQVNSASPSGTGAFDLSRRLFPLRELEPNQPGPVAEFLDPDCLETSCVHYYRLHLEGQLQEDLTLRLDMKVPFAAILELLDANWNPLEKGETEIRSHMKSDRYIIRVSTKSRTYGSYVLTAGSAGN
jgi:hypothetical protein